MISLTPLPDLPAYSSFYKTIKTAHCRAVENHLKLVDGRYEMDFEQLESIIDHDTNTLILCNPQNPTGNCWSADDMMTLGEICVKRRVVLIADEIHCDFVNNGQFWADPRSPGLVFLGYRRKVFEVLEDVVQISSITLGNLSWRPSRQLLPVCPVIAKFSLADELECLEKRYPPFRYKIRRFRWWPVMFKQITPPYRRPTGKDGAADRA